MIISIQVINANADARENQAINRDKLSNVFVSYSGQNSIFKHPVCFF